MVEREACARKTGAHRKKGLGTVPLAVCDHCASALVGQRMEDEERRCPYCGQPSRRVTLAEFRRCYKRWRAQGRDVTLAESPRRSEEETPESGWEPGDDATQSRK